MQENKLKCYTPFEYSNRLNSASHFYKNMFIEDISTGIIPIRMNDDENELKVIIDTEKKDIELIKTILNSFAIYSEEYNIEKLVKYAIEGIARDISWYGDAIYEIYEDNENKIKFIRLIPDKFIDMKLFYIQIPPKDAYFKYKFIGKKSLWKISIPKNLQKKYSYKKILSFIDKFDSLMPKPFKDNLYDGNKNYYNYDSKKYKEKQFLYVNDLTSEWGWDQRSMSDEYITEFFKNYKYIKFNLSQAFFREHIINELNSLFKKLDIRTSIKIEGLSTSKDLEEHIKKYISNEVRYDDVFNIIK